MIYPTHLVLLPGTLCTKVIFERQAQDLKSYTGSQILPLAKGSSIATMASWVLNQAPETFALAGFSQGAIVAMEIMRQAPKRVSKLCLLSANPRPSTLQQVEVWNSWKTLVKAGQFRDVAEGFANNVHPDRKTDLQLRTQILDMAKETGEEVFLNQLAALASRIDSRPYLPEISCPSLLMVGKEDKVTPLDLHLEIQQQIPRARLVVVEQSGHYLPLEQPEAVMAALVDWLKF